jgi:hypothetical protein
VRSNKGIEYYERYINDRQTPGSLANFFQENETVA